MASHEEQVLSLVVGGTALHVGV